MDELSQSILDLSTPCLSDVLLSFRSGPFPRLTFPPEARPQRHLIISKPFPKDLVSEGHYSFLREKQSQCAAARHI